MIQASNSDTDIQLLIQQAMEQNSLPQRLDMSPNEASKGLVQLALTVVNLLRELMEKQAMRRMDSGVLKDEEIETLGSTFMLLEDQMDHLKEVFDLTEDDLCIDLGPIGSLS